ncbi:hypothetical protein EVAR_88530_1 [Eumeta japonica]|uniref:Uncharacterized protein n=1 Tax=Eumeta variegata TaxID=151549 RepID=A0A4C1WK50_EUMVA|nr:hypothetical protein EVAR_88530_1 [Eumeta japonica]
MIDDRGADIEVSQVKNDNDVARAIASVSSHRSHQRGTPAALANSRVLPASASVLTYGSFVRVILAVTTCDGSPKFLYRL